MTIRFLTGWNGYYEGQIATLANEVALISAGIAIADTQSFRPGGMILFGDSFSFSSWVIDSDQNKLSSRGFAPIANMILGNPFTPKVNAGKSGDTVAAMLARIYSDVLPYVRPGDIVFLQGGINSLVAGASAESIIEDMRKICEILAAAGAVISLGSVCPSALRITGTEINNRLGRVNVGYKNISTSVANVIFSDDFAAMSLPAETLSINIPGYSADGLHPNTSGAMAIARVRARSLSRLQLKRVAINETNQDYTNIVYNSQAVGANATGVNGATIGAGITGVFCPNGYSVSRAGTLTAVLSKRQKADGRMGEFARAAITGGAAGDLLRWQWTLTTSGVRWAASTAYPVSWVRAPTVDNGFVYQVITAGTTGATQPVWPLVAGETITDGSVVWATRNVPVAGDSVEAVCEFELSGWTGNAMVQMYINYLNSSSAVIFQQSANFLYAGDAPPDYTPPSGVLFIPGVPLPAGVSSAILYIECLTTGAATGNFDLTNVSARLINR